MGYLVAGDLADVDLGVGADVLTLLIGTASDMVDKYCGRTFAVPAADASEAREFEVDRREGVAVIDDLLDSDGATVEALGGDRETWTALTVGEDFEWRPYNGTPKEQVIFFDRVDLVSRVDRPGCGVGRVRVTGRFGFGEAVPDAIKMAVRLMVVRLSQRAMQAAATKREAMGDYSITYSVPDGLGDVSGVRLDMTERLLMDPYRKGRV